MKVAIAGYFGFGNLGDELILSSVIRQIRARYGRPAISVLSARPDATRRDHGVESCHRWNPLAASRALASADVLVMPGGLIQDKTSLASLVYYLALILFARLFGTTVVLYGLGVERVRSALGRRLVRAALNSREVRITVRDESSRQLLENFGVDAAQVHVTGDPVFCRTAETAPRERYQNRPPSVLFIPRFPCPPTALLAYRSLVDAVRRHSNTELRVMLFQYDAESEAMLAAAETIGVDPAWILPKVSVEKTVDTLSQVDAVVSARDHGLVLAALHERPFVGVGDPEKTGRLCDALDMPFVPWEKPGQAATAVDSLLRRSPQAYPSLERLKATAARSVDFLSVER